MIYTQHYDSPLGGILLSADEAGLTGLWFDGAKYFAKGLPQERTDQETPALLQAKQWLDLYFSGVEPDFTPPLHPTGTAFQQAVWQLLLQIPYGQTTANWPAGSPGKKGAKPCRLRPWAARWGTIPFR